MLGPGVSLGKYQLQRKLGSGGFGDVFVARDTSLDRDVALKFLRPEHSQRPEIVARFLQEARSAAKIIHAGIVTIHECGVVSGTATAADGTGFIAMELLAGETLAERLARVHRLRPTEVIDLGRQLASALAAAHRAGIVHRDLKPENVFLVVDPMLSSGERVKILDFGIAKLADASLNQGVQTQASAVFGTPRYMSPEQCRSSAQVDQRSDIYTLGCILFELLTGRPPFDGAPGELIAAHLMLAPPAVSELVPTTPRPLVDLIARMLEKAIERRPASMHDVERALAQITVATPAAFADTAAHAPIDDTVRVEFPVTIPVAPTAPPSLAPPAATVLPPATTVSPSPVAPNPTTLSALAGSKTAPPTARRRSLAITVGLTALLAISIPVGVYIARSGGSAPAAIQPAAAPRVSEPVAKPIEAPRPPPPPPVQIENQDRPENLGPAIVPAKEIEKQVLAPDPIRKARPPTKSTKPVKPADVAKAPEPKPVDPPKPKQSGRDATIDPFGGTP